MPTAMTIAIDYDAFTADPVLWLDVIRLIKSCKCNTVCVSYRFDTPENREEIESCVPGYVKVYLCGYTPKLKYMETQGVDVSILISEVSHE